MNLLTNLSAAFPALLAVAATSAPTTAPAGGGFGLGAFLITAAYLGAAACFVTGLKMLGHPRNARQGNRIAAGGMVLAVFATLLDPRVVHGGRYGVIFAGLLIGGLIGAALALRVKMRGMPQMVALLNGFGGMAAAMVGWGEYLTEAYGPIPTALDFRISVAMSLIIGMITFTGSLVAWAKLEELKIKGVALSNPLMAPNHQLINTVLGGVMLVLALVLALSDQAGLSAFLILILAAGLGVLLVLPIGGADMPVVIALLNSLSGLGAAATGFVLHNYALIISGSLVGAAGTILTLIMCRAMNRSLLNVLAGGFGGTPTAVPVPAAALAGGTIRRMDAEEAAMVIEAASSVIIVPGYGMAVAQAQHSVAELASVLAKRGVSVKFAIHPVAGRMPGHMNVLLAEANVPYEQLHDLEINPEFKQCDVALVIGANDVVNPAARTDKASPIYGMPIFDVDQARTVMVCKRSLNPGFAGIENALFIRENTVMLFGDAKATIVGIVNELKGG